MQIRDVAEFEYVNKHLASVELARSMLKDTISVSYQPIFTEQDFLANSYNAVFAPKDSVLIFMSDKPFYKAILMTKFSKGSWSEPEVINNDIELDGFIRLSSVSYDGNELYVVKTENYQSDIYVSYFEDGKWSPASGIIEINTEFNESHASLNKSKRKLYFVSDRPDGLGAKDIYYSNRNQDGSWDKPVNLGKPVNSVYSENSPFITEDDKTLYFSSMGHATMGGYDIFYSSLLPTGQWSYPANLGFPLSTTSDDLYYFPFNNGKQALIAGNPVISARKEVLIVEQKHQHAEPTFALSGKVKSQDDVFLNENETMEVMNISVQDSSADGNPEVEKVESIINLAEEENTKEASTLTYNIIEEQIKATENINLKDVRDERGPGPEEVGKYDYILAKNILFGFNSDTLSNEAKFELESLYRIMSHNPEVMIELTGHTDSKGTREYNFKMAESRTESVINYLVSKGVNRERFISKAMGEENNFAINENPDGTDNQEGRRFNRQVEIKLANNHQAENIWIEEYLVPEKLKSEPYRNYYLLFDETATDKYQASFNRYRDEIKIYETARNDVYAAGKFKTKRNAIEYLNKDSDLDFRGGRVVNEEELNYLLRPLNFDTTKSYRGYTIQLLALRKPDNSGKFKNLEDLKKIQDTDGIHRYVYGLFENLNAAKNQLSTFVLWEFNDAVILPVTSINRNNKPEILTENPDYYYIIQICVTRKEMDLSNLSNIIDVVTANGADGLYRYSSAMFLNKNEAEITLQKIKQESYTEALLKKISKIN
jgi:outer membrane protein OmpA-like peptidoglycan-associated protein